MALERARGRAKVPRVTLAQEVRGSLRPILAGRQYLLNAGTRRLDNGIKFSRKEGGRVRLRAWPGGRGAHIEVVDQGIGMPAAQPEKIFDLFYQIERAKLEQQGFGSLLAIAQSRVQLHGGEITAASQVNEGSTVAIELPALKE